MIETALDWVMRHQLIVLVFVSLPILVLIYRSWLISIALSLFRLPAYTEYKVEAYAHDWNRIAAFILLFGVACVFTASVEFKAVSPTLGLEIPNVVKPRNAQKTDRILVFIHGWNGDQDNTWEQFPKLVMQDENLPGLSVLSIGYPTYMVRRNLTIVEFADWLVGEIEKKAKRLGVDELQIVAHSMGGLIAREISLLLDTGSSSLALKKIVAIGTPHEGTNTAALASALGISKKLTSAMSPKSSYISGLRVRWSKFSRRPPTACFSSPHDKVVSQASALAQCDKIKSYPKWGHSELVKPINQDDSRYFYPIKELNFSPPVVELVLSFNFEVQRSSDLMSASIG